MNTNKLLLVFIGIVSLSVGSKDSNSVLNTLNNQTTFRSNADSLFNLKNQINFPTISENETPDTTSNLTSNQIQRFKRAADPLSDYSMKLSTVARISNGISLLAGLINKNIPIDNVISELLHFGNAKLSDVLALQKDKVEAVFNQLETTKQNLDASSAVKVLEENTIGMGRVREAFIKSKFESFKHPTDYFTEAQSFKDDKTDYSVFKTAEISVADALTKFDELATIQDNVQSNKALLEDKITGIGNKLEKLLTVSQQMSQIGKAVDSYSKLADGETILKPMQQMLDLLAVHQSLPPVTVDYVADAGKNMDALNSFLSSFASAQSAIVVLRDLALSRLVPSYVNHQFTSGFPNGAADLKKLVKDIRDPAFESTIGGGKNFVRLSGGLKPLEEFAKKLEASEAQLKPMATAEMLHAADNAAQLQKLMTGLTVSSSNAVSVAQMLLDNQFNKIADAFVTPVINLIGNAEKLSKELAHVKSSASAFPQPSQEVTDVKTILRSLPNPNDHNDVQKVIDALKKVPEKVKATTEYLKKLQDFLKDVPDPTDTRKTANLIFKADGDLKTLKGIIDKNIVPKLNAIKDSKESIDSVVRALQASKIIRDFKTDDGTRIVSAMGTIEKAVPSIKDLQKTSRKKRQTDEVNELIGFKDAQKTSESLGSAAITISSMAQLKGMETTVVQDLKSKSPVFDTELGKIQDQQKKANILAKWGDHMAFASSLDSTIKQIKAFGAKLSIDKDLRKLGAHLKDAKAVGDVKQNIADKSEAVGILILETSDTQAKAELEALKTQLDILAALDLQFSNHHSAFPDVQGALNSLFDFLGGFLTPKKLATAPPINPGNSGPSGTRGTLVAPQAINGNPVNGSSNNSTSDSFDFMILVYVGVALVLLAICGVVGYLGYVNYRDRKKPWDTIEALWLAPLLGKERCGQKFEDGSWHFIEQAPKGTGSTVEDRMRRNQSFHSKTRVKISNGFINANWIKVKGAPVFIATQGPLDGDEMQYVEQEGPNGTIRAVDQTGKVLGDKKGKRDTREDFLQMVVETSAEYIVQLCRTEERDLEFLGDVYMVQKSAPYYPPVNRTQTFGRYAVTNHAEDEILDGEGRSRSLSIHDNKTGKKHKCKQLHWLEWGDHDIPKSWEKGLRLMEMVNKSKKPIIVHCSMGLGRTCSFISIETMACEAERRPNKHPSKMAADLRGMRCGAIQSAQQFHYGFICAVANLIRKFGGDLVNESDEKTAVWEEHLSAYEEARQLEKVGAEKVPMTNRRQNHKMRMKKKAKAGKKQSSEGSKTPETSKEASKTPEESKSAEPSREPAGGEKHVAIDMED